MESHSAYGTFVNHACRQGDDSAAKDVNTDVTSSPSAGQRSRGVGGSSSKASNANHLLNFQTYSGNNSRVRSSSFAYFDDIE